MAKKTVFSVLVALLSVALVEATSRVAFFALDGGNPYYLMYGFVPDVNRNSVQHAGYTKFPPNAVRRQKVPDGVVRMRINSDGFRSPYDFRKPKPAGTIRIAALGASSTFGYHAEDDETYPYLLQQRFRETHPERIIEVLNLGIPGFRVENILAMARNELRRLEPDIVTLYAGANNSTRHRAPEDAGLLYEGKNWLAFHSVTWRRLLHPLAKAGYYRIAALFNKDLAGLPNLGVPVRLPAARIGELRSELRTEFRRSVESLADLADSLGASFVPITQTFVAARLGTVDQSGPLSTYEEEVARVEEALRTQGSLPAPEATVLIHRDLMDELRAIAEERALPLVEGIEVLDRDRTRYLASWVHLTPEGNRMLAAAIHRTIDAHRLLVSETPDSRFTGAVSNP